MKSSNSPIEQRPAVEQRAAILDGKSIPYTLKRSGNRRSIGLRIDDRGLTVSMPLRASENWLHSVLEEKARWVLEKLDGWELRKPEEVRWQDGETIPFLGDLLTLRVTQSPFAVPPARWGNELKLFFVRDCDEKKIERAVTLWYKREALQLFEQRVALYAPLLAVSPTEVKLSSAKTQWGCCTAHGTVRLNLQLVKLPVRLIDYVVVHELAHLREMNHSSAFWRVVGSACPCYKKLRAELKAVVISP